MREQEESSGAKYQNLMGRQRSAYGKAGVDLASGSPLLIAVDTAAQAEEEFTRIHEAGLQTAALDKYYGDEAAFSGTMGGVGQFLTGLTKAGMMSQMSKKGSDTNALMMMQGFMN